MHIIDYESVILDLQERESHPELNMDKPWDGPREMNLGEKWELDKLESQLEALQMGAGNGPATLAKRREIEAFRKKVPY